MTRHVMRKQERISVCKCSEDSITRRNISGNFNGCSKTENSLGSNNRES